MQARCDPATVHAGNPIGARASGPIKRESDMDTDYMQTISETQAIRHTCRTIMRETDVIVRDTAGTWTVNPAHDPDVWKAAHELHAAASSRADAIIAASLPAASPWRGTSRKAPSPHGNAAGSDAAGSDRGRQ
jgi:hypothetical protein